MSTEPPPVPPSGAQPAPPGGPVPPSTPAYPPPSSGYTPTPVGQVPTGYAQPGAYPQPGLYPQPGYGNPGYAPVAGPRTNVLAIISLICSCAGIFFWFLAPIAGVVMGHISLSQIKRTGEGGRGMALAGVIVGYSLLGLSILFVIGYFVVLALIVAAAGASGYDSYSG